MGHDFFDSWGGVLADGAFQRFSLDYTRRVVQGLQREKDGQRIPCIVFTKGGGQWLEAIAASGCDAVGLDWTTDLGEARRRVGDRVALQGNLDPMALFASPDKIAAQARQHFDRGVELFREEDWAGALSKFTASFDLVPNATLRYNMGVCRFNLGQLAEAGLRRRRSLRRSSSLRRRRSLRRPSSPRRRSSPRTTTAGSPRRGGRRWPTSPVRSRSAGRSPAGVWGRSGPLNALRYANTSC